MVTNRLDQVFAAVADPTRRQILDRLAEGDATVGVLARPFGISRPAVSKHLQVLERAGLISRMRRGRRTVCRLRPEALREANDWVQRYRAFWEGRLDALAEILEEES